MNDEIKIDEEPLKVSMFVFRFFFDLDATLHGCLKYVEHIEFLHLYRVEVLVLRRIYPESALVINSLKTISIVAIGLLTSGI